MRLKPPSIGACLQAIGVVHVATTPLFFGDSLRSIADAGVLFSVESDPDAFAVRASGFWYATAGLAVIATGVLTRHSERRLGSPPPALPAVLLGFGAWGVLLDPQGGFWLFLPLAALAQRRVRAARVRGPAPGTAQETTGTSALERNSAR